MTVLETELSSKSNLTCDEAKGFLARLSNNAKEAKRELTALIDKLDVRGAKSMVTALWGGEGAEKLAEALKKEEEQLTDSALPGL